ncbi:hypothetical protein Q8A73_021340 [Channa argus]|nr:hypothetical protein Q8A73_021340 [Channa argus]
MASSLACDRIRIERGSLLNRIKNFCVLDGMQSNNHCRWHRRDGPHQHRNVNKSPPPAPPGPINHVDKQAGLAPAALRPSGGACLLENWTERDGGNWDWAWGAGCI